jgi:hypothetical protein
MCGRSPPARPVRPVPWYVGNDRATSWGRVRRFVDAALGLAGKRDAWAARENKSLHTLYFAGSQKVMRPLGVDPVKLFPWPPDTGVRGDMKHRIDVIARSGHLPGIPKVSLDTLDTHPLESRIVAAGNGSNRQTSLMEPRNNCPPQETSTPRHQNSPHQCPHNLLILPPRSVPPVTSNVNRMQTPRAAKSKVMYRKTRAERQSSNSHVRGLT